jgi:quercetin dioxygenase-like cupin family protein
VSVETIQVLSPAERPEVDLLVPGGGGSARAIVWPGVGAQARTMHLVSLPAGAASRELSHRGEAVYYVVAGTGVVLDAAAGTDTEVVEGSMVHVEPGTPYSFAAGPDGIELVGGPGPADPDLYREA